MSARYFSMSAKAALRRGSLTDAMAVGGSASSGVLAAELDLRPKMVFTRERSWLRLLDAFIFCWIWNLFLN